MCVKIYDIVLKKTKAIPVETMVPCFNGSADMIIILMLLPFGGANVCSLLIRYFRVKFSVYKSKYVVLLI